MSRLGLGGAALTLVLAASALAQTTIIPGDGNGLHQRALAATCANCHGSNGRAIEGSTVPGLAGLPANYMVEQMKAFKTGARPATVMHQIAKGYSDAQIEQLGAYFASQTR